MRHTSNERYQIPKKSHVSLSKGRYTEYRERQWSFHVLLSKELKNVTSRLDAVAYGCLKHLPQRLQSTHAVSPNITLQADSSCSLNPHNGYSIG